LQKYINQNQFVLGIDTGSTKTHAVISDLTGKVVGFSESGCGNYEIVNKQGFENTLNDAVDKVITVSGIEKRDINSMGFGFSGYDWPSENPIMIKAINSLGITCPYTFVNDVTLGLIAGSSAGWGIAVDAGSGNNVRGRDRSGNIGRISGNGLQFGEFGGASELVWRGMIAAIYAWTLRGPKTRITDLLMNYANADSEDALIEGLAIGKIHLPSKLAKDIIQLALEGDAVAQDVINFNARELGLNVNAVVRQLEFQDLHFEVVMMGSVFNSGEIYTNPFINTVLEFAPNAQFIHLSVPPVVGAVLLAAEVLEITKKEFKNTLVESTKEFIS